MQPVFIIDVFSAVQGDQEVLAGLKPELFKYPAVPDFPGIMIDDLVDGIADDVDFIGRDAFAEQVGAAALGVGHPDVAGMVDDAAVDLLRDAIVITAVAGLQVENGYAQVMTIPPNVEYQDLFLKLEQEAREAALRAVRWRTRPQARR